MYKHLTRDERYQIAILLKAGKRQNQIAALMNRHPSSISRELKRNLGQRGYRPKQALTTVAESPKKYGQWSMRNSARRGVPSRFPAISRPTTSPVSATSASISASMPTSVPAERCTVPCAARRHAENVIRAANGAARSPIRCRLINDRQ